MKHIYVSEINTIQLSDALRMTGGLAVIYILVAMLLIVPCLRCQLANSLKNKLKVVDPFSSDEAREAYFRQRVSYEGLYDLNKRVDRLEANSNS